MSKLTTFLTMLFVCISIFAAGCSSGSSNGSHCPCHPVDPSGTPQPAPATYKISGFVKSGDTAIPQARVTIVKDGEVDGITVFTNDQGYFVLTNLENASYTITVSAPNYTDQTLPTHSYPEGQTPPPELYFNMQPIITV